MMFRPQQYVQRIIERMTFLPDGQRWQRDIQLHIPTEREIESGDADGIYVVSLGMFERRRFPDFSVSNSDGTRCALLTRRQHGYCLATCMIRQFLTLEEWKACIATEDRRHALADLYDYLTTTLTTIPNDDLRTGEEAGRRLKSLFKAIEINDKQRRRRASALLRYSCEVLRNQTQYLCWIYAKPGSLVRLSTEYTTAASPDISFADFREKDDAPAIRLWFRNFRMYWYSRVRLLPMHYRIYIPSNAQCGSYYFMIDPPADTKITLLEWGTGRRFHVWARRNDTDQLREIDSAAFACHMHNGSGRRHPYEDDPRTAPPSDIRSGRLHAFVRSAPYEHDKLVAACVFSLVLALLAQNGTFAHLGQGERNQLLLLAPTAILIFIGQQQRHHFGRFTRPFRLLMWGYIAVAAIFAGAEALVADGEVMKWLEGNTGNRLVTAGFALVSVTFAMLFMATGKYFDKWTEGRFNKVIKRVRELGTPSWLLSLMPLRRRQLRAAPVGPVANVVNGVMSEEELFGSGGFHPADRIYSAVGRHWIDRVVCGIIVVWLVGAGMMVAFGWGGGRRAVLDQQAAARKEAVEQQEYISELAHALGRRVPAPANPNRLVCRSVLGCVSGVETASR